MPINYERYGCQIALPDFGDDAQRRLSEARVLIVGAGGLGCPVSQYLVAAGVGTIGIVDDDRITMSNLHRQILYTTADIGKLKAAVAVERLQEQNPETLLIAYPIRVSSDNVMELVAGYDLVIEGTDNIGTKCLLNDACVLSGKPLVYGAVYQREGHVSVWNVLHDDGSYSPNYRDVFPAIERAQVPNCREGGVMPPLVGIVGSMQANEAIKYFTQRGSVLAGKLWIFNAEDGRTNIIRLKKNNIRPITALLPSVSLISFETVKDATDCFELIDVRTAEEHSAFNIGGRCISIDTLHENLDRLKTVALPVVCYCHSGGRSATAASIIKGAYPEKTVYSLAGGIAGLMARNGRG